MGDRYIRQPCNSQEGASDVRRWLLKGERHLPKGAAHEDAVRSRMPATDVEADVVSARMRLLYDYRAPAGTRWSPTSEQLRELLALFHVGGLRTPSTAQISRITARLRVHGRIEGRNVFYWFQNQKARERKRRLQLMQAAATAPPSASATSPNHDAPSSSPQGLPPAEGPHGLRILAPEQLQPKRCRLSEAHFDAGCRSSSSSTPEEIDCAATLRQLWPSCQHDQLASEDLPVAVPQHLVEPEEDDGLLMQNFNNLQACSRMLNTNSVARIKHDHSSSVMPQGLLIDSMAAEDERSDVSDANVQHCASPFANFIWQANYKKHSSVGYEIDRAAGAETLMEQQAGAHGCLQASLQSLEPTCSLPALTLFPLSPTSSSAHDNHHHSFLRSCQIQDLKGSALSPSLCRQSSLLDLKLAIDN